MGELANIQIIDILKAVLQIGLMTWAFYQFYMALDRTKIQRMLKMIFYAITIYAISFILKLDILVKLFNILAIPYVVFLCIIFQAELRRSFLTEGLGKTRLKLSSINNYSDQIDIALNACSVLQNKRRGALLVFSRRDSLNSVISSGTTLNADLSMQLILTVFDHDTPLHDGAMVIQDGKIKAAGCYLPLSEQTDIKKTFGTRHRAALGISEETDSIVIVVSEETGTITLAYNARLFYDLEVDNIKRVLLTWFSNKDILEEEEDIKEDEK
ncbi:MAG: diadenylate cyclase CdaA [Pleomorphochaeta sp.]